MKTDKSEYEKQLQKRMDRYDAIVHEFLRSHRKTTIYFSEKIGCDQSSLWRYRRELRAFCKMPMQILSESFRLMNTSNEDMRFILGLPTGKAER